MLNWVKLAMEVRKDDVIKRILNNRRLTALREAAIKQEQERQVERKAFFDEEKQKWEDEMAKKREAEEERKAREKEQEEEDEDEDDYFLQIASQNDYGNEGEQKKVEGEGEGDKDKAKELGEDEGEEEEEEKFDEAEVYERFDEEKPPIEIPLEVIDDIDNDIDISEEELQTNEEGD